MCYMPPPMSVIEVLPVDALVGLSRIMTRTTRQIHLQHFHVERAGGVARTFIAGHRTTGPVITIGCCRATVDAHHRLQCRLEVMMFIATRCSQVDRIQKV